MPITVTPKAAKEILRVMEEQQLPANETVLRLGVQGSGCSGFAYSMTFSREEEINPLDDTLYNFDGLKVAVGNKFESYIDGISVDFHDGLDRRGFIFDNPMAKRVCGCGSSFSV